jgi:hypothetical protein
MENFKLASQQKLRFQTTKGLLSAEQLWDLSLQDLDMLAVSLEAEHKESGRKSFLTKTSAKDKTAKLRFDIVLDILNTKVEEEQIALAEIERKANNQKIISIIADKQDESLKGKSIKQLEAMLQ